MRRALALAALALAALAGAAPARSQAPPPPLDDNTLLFCQSDTGEIRPMTYANLGVVVRRYASRFNFRLSVQGPPLQLVFSNPAETPYSVTYKAQAYTDDAGRKGVLVQSMHLFLDNADRDVTGTPMCYFTEFGR